MSRKKAPVNQRGQAIERQNRKKDEHLQLFQEMASDAEDEIYDIISNATDEELTKIREGLIAYTADEKITAHYEKRLLTIAEQLAAEEIHRRTKAAGKISSK